MDTKIICLAVLERGAASGYEIKKALEDAPHFYFQDVSFGSLYPALGRLADEGLVDVAQMAQDKRPDKKVYTITDAGRRVLRDALCQPPAPDRVRSDFLFLLMHGDLVPPQHLMAMVDRRIAELEAMVEQIEACECDAGSHTPSQRLLHAIGLDYYRNSVRCLRENRGWLEEALGGGDQQAAE